jgi:para-nitrobenzyl esterase
MVVSLVYRSFSELFGVPFGTFLPFDRKKSSTKSTWRTNVMSSWPERTARQKKFVLMAIALMTGSFMPLEPERAAAQSGCVVTVADGDVQGSNLGAACAFLGIPYAASTAGNNRWRPPQAPTPWAGVLNATGTPAACPSVNLAGPTPVFSGVEDCLKLNVWAPNPVPTGPAPVIVWLHTGAFIGASGFFAGHRGQTLAAETSAIVVSPNYRLGPFGFLAHSALDSEDPHSSSGNYGLLDQQAALRWVRDNIAQFGGDPNNVTIAGTSAGGQSVGLQLVSPGSEGLFHRAIIQSAYPTSRWTTDPEAKAQGNAFATALGCTDPAQVLTCMRSSSRDAVLTALPQAAQQVVEPPGRTFWEPSVDGVVIPDQPRIRFESGEFHRVPTVVGFNRDEGWGSFISRFITLSFPSGVNLAQYEGWVMNEFGPHASSVLDFYPASSSTPIEVMARLVGDVQFVCEARRVARAIERTGTPTYVYSYEYIIDELSAAFVLHGVESNILFGNNYSAPVFPSHTLDAADQALHLTMAGYWTRFAASGNPNRGDDSAFSWPRFNRPDGRGRGTDKYIILDSVIQEGERLRETQCDFFEPFFFRSVLGGVPAAGL